MIFIEIEAKNRVTRNCQALQRRNSSYPRRSCPWSHSWLGFSPACVFWHHWWATYDNPSMIQIMIYRHHIPGQEQGWNTHNCTRNCTRNCTQCLIAICALYFNRVHPLSRIQAHKDNKHEDHDDVENDITSSLNQTYSGSEISNRAI